jgi:hypothetical protein
MLHNIFGELGLDGTLQKISHYLGEISNNIGKWYPNTSGQMPVTVASGTVTTVTTVTTMTNQSQMSGYSTAYDQYCQMLAGAAAIRSQITTS